MGSTADEHSVSMGGALLLRLVCRLARSDSDPSSACIIEVPVPVPPVFARLILPLAPYCTCACELPATKYERRRRVCLGAYGASHDEGGGITISNQGQLPQSFAATWETRQAARAYRRGLMKCGWYVVLPSSSRSVSSYLGT